MMAFASAGWPAFYFRFSDAGLRAGFEALIFGIGIVGGAFLLSWAAEVAQLDLSASFALGAGLILLNPRRLRQVISKGGG